jgi:hypothetical protein
MRSASASLKAIGNSIRAVLRSSLAVKQRVFYLDAEEGPQTEGETVRRKMVRLPVAMRRRLPVHRIAKDVDRRCQQHNAGTASRYTRSRLPVVAVYREAHASRSLALRREAAIKALSRRQKEALIRLAG